MQAEILVAECVLPSLSFPSLLLLSSLSSFLQTKGKEERRRRGRTRGGAKKLEDAFRRIRFFAERGRRERRNSWARRSRERGDAQILVF